MCLSGKMSLCLLFSEWGISFYWSHRGLMHQKFFFGVTWNIFSNPILMNRSPNFLRVLYKFLHTCNHCWSEQILSEFIINISLLLLLFIAFSFFSRLIEIYTNTAFSNIISQNFLMNYALNVAFFRFLFSSIFILFLFS